MQDRGSSALMARLFGREGPVTRESLAAAVADAQSAQFKIVRWWWRGQPAIDWVSAVLEVQPKDLGETISTVAQLQGAGTNVTADVFPYGLPQLDRVHVHVKVGLAIR